ncbi:ATP-binding protein [Flavobacteriaceae bacterium MHTCC 0001]
MMNSLLKRQIRKYLPSKHASSEDLTEFLDAINRSYANFDEQYVMQQRAMAISSEELSVANEQLQQETKAQNEVIKKLRHVIDTLKFYQLPEQEGIDNADINGLKLVELIDGQTKEIVEINKQREKLLNELAYQNQELSDYAHMVSHDLKSPLRNIDALTSWLKEDYEGALDDTGKDRLKMIRTNVEKMDKLISGILDYSTINKNETEFYDVDTNKLVNDIIAIMKVPGHISIIKASTLPKVKGDKYRLQQIFQNLIDNAIKYNDKAKGIVEIAMIDKEDFWEFQIKDNGKGIDKQYFDKIFNTFIKLENNPESSGIGLSIVKKIVTHYGGKVWVTSTIGEGTTFYFTLKK